MNVACDVNLINCILPTQFVYKFRVIETISGDYFRKHH
jgi:hypothetical protein